MKMSFENNKPKMKREIEYLICIVLVETIIFRRTNKNFACYKVEIEQNLNRIFENYLNFC